MAIRKKRRDRDAVKAKDVKAKKVDYLWRQRIPVGMLTILAGRPDQGKGLLATHIAADVTRRGGNVIHSAQEDDHSMMTRPRLEAAGADLNRVLLWRFTLPRQLNELEATVKRIKARLVIIDPFLAHLAGVSRYSDNLRHKVTNPLSDIAEDTGCTFIIVEHALKKMPKDAHPLAAIGGPSSGLPAAARGAYVFGEDPKDSDRRILVCVKLNVAKEKPRALVFESDVEDVGLVGEMPILLPKEEIDFDARLLLGKPAEPGKAGRKPEKRAEASEWIAQYIAANGGPVKAGDIQEDSKHYGISKQTLRRAVDEMGIVKDPPGGGRTCTWDLPADLWKAVKG